MRLPACAGRDAASAIRRGGHRSACAPVRRDRLAAPRHGRRVLRGCCPDPLPLPGQVQGEGPGKELWAGCPALVCDPRCSVIVADYHSALGFVCRGWTGDFVELLRVLPEDLAT